MRLVPGVCVLAIATAAFGQAPPAAPAPAPSTAAPAPPRKKAPPSMRLGSPKEEEPAAPAGNRYPWATEADTALARAILFAVEPAPEEIRVSAVEDLAFLGDARALNVLAELIFDPNTNVQLAALRAVSHFQTPRAEEILENVVRHPRLPDLMKIKAVGALPFQASPTSREFLNDTATNGRWSAPVRAAARQALQDLQPPFAPSG
jgi:hypothetical protein